MHAAVIRTVLEGGGISARVVRGQRLGDRILVAVWGDCADAGQVNRSGVNRSRADWCGVNRSRANRSCADGGGVNRRGADRSCASRADGGDGFAATDHFVAGGRRTDRSVGDGVEASILRAVVVVARGAGIIIAVAIVAGPPATVSPATVILTRIAVSVAEGLAVGQVIVFGRSRVEELLGTHRVVAR